MFGGEPIIKTRAEQTLEWLDRESRIRALTNEEARQLDRCLHAIHERNKRRAFEEVSA